jgi:hypothetical protein
VVPYVGYLTFASGAPYSGTLAQVDVLLWDTQTPVEGAVPLWSESFSSVGVQAGMLSLVLGSPTNPLTPALFNQPGKTLWLQFEIDGVPMAGLQRVASVPYALRSGDSDLLGGQPPSAYLTASALGTQGFVKADGTVPVTGSLALQADATVMGSLAVGDRLLLGDGAGGCDPASEGALRYNSADGRVEFCNGSAWTALGGAVGPSGSQFNPAASCQAILNGAPNASSGNYWIDPDGSGAAESFQTHCLMVGASGWTLLGKVSGLGGEAWRYDSNIYSTASSLNSACLLDSSNCDGKAPGWGSLSVSLVRVELPGEGNGEYTLSTPGTLASKLGSFDPNATSDFIGTPIGSRTGGSFTKYDGLYTGTRDSNAPSEGASDRCRIIFTSETNLTGSGLSDNNTNTICVGRVRGVSSNSFVEFSTLITGNQRADLARFANGNSPTLEGPLRIYGR